jgi:hypothetical protein
VTPDGRHQLFEAVDGSGLRPGYSHGTCVTGSGPRPCRSEDYVYSVDGSTPLDPNVVCASCNAGEPGAPFDASFITFEGLGASGFIARQNHPISDDGRWVFFNTDEPLVPEDTNQRVDAYEYDMQIHSAQLLSSGKSTSPSYFMDVSANGADAFFTTRERLVGWDRDDAYDVYDARIGGGFPEPVPPPAPCSGDTCQGQIPLAPGLGAIGSNNFRGRGDVRSSLQKPKAKRCGRGRVKKRVNGKTRCVRSHRARKKRSRRAKRSRHSARRAGQ